MPISLDYSNMMVDAVGSEFGIHEQDIYGLRAQTKEIHRQIQIRREHGELPFYDLPDCPEIIDEILALAREVQENFQNLVDRQEWCRVTVSQNCLILLGC